MHRVCVCHCSPQVPAVRAPHQPPVWRTGPPPGAAMWAGPAPRGGAVLCRAQCAKWLQGTHGWALLVLERDLEVGLDVSWGDWGEGDGHFDRGEGANLALCYLHGKTHVAGPLRFTFPRRHLPLSATGRVPGRVGGGGTHVPVTSSWPHRLWSQPGPALQRCPALDPGRRGEERGRLNPSSSRLPRPWHTHTHAHTRTTMAGLTPHPEIDPCRSGPVRRQLGTGRPGVGSASPLPRGVKSSGQMSLVWLWSHEGPPWEGVSRPAGRGWRKVGREQGGRTDLPQRDLHLFLIGEYHGGHPLQFWKRRHVSCEDWPGREGQLSPDPPEPQSPPPTAAGPTGS